MLRNLSPFKQGLFAGWITIVLAVLILVVGVKAAHREFNPQDAVEDTAQSQSAVPSNVDSPNTTIGVSPVLDVLETSATYNGAGPAGYGRSGMYAACRLEDPASHFCSVQEIETAWKIGGLNLVLTGQAWIDNAVLGTNDSGYTGDTQAASDWYGGNAVGDFPDNCNAWTVSANANRGLIINSGSISPAVEACDDTHPVACCKRAVTYGLYLPLIVR